MKTYIATIFEEAGKYGVSFPDFPGCVTSADTLDELQHMAQEALQFHVDGMIEDGDSIPQPSDLTTVKAHEFARESVATMLVAVRIPGKTVRISLTADEYDLAAIDQAVSKYGGKRSSFLIQAGLDKARRL